MDAISIVFGTGFAAAAVLTAALVLVDRRTASRAQGNRIYGRRPPGASWQGLLIGGSVLMLAGVFIGGAPGGELNAGRADVVFLLDVSRSMDAQDVSPSRVARAREDIARAVSRAGSGRFGLVAFSGDAVLVCPLTTDRAAFVAALTSVTGNSIPGGTALAPALDRAVRMFPDRPGEHVVVLVSDGENLSGKPDGSAANARRAGVRVYTVGVGTPAGAQIPEPSPDGPTWVRGADGSIVTSRLDEPALRAIADATAALYQGPDSSEPWRFFQTLTAPAEPKSAGRVISAVALGVALGLLAGEQFLRTIAGLKEVSA